MFFHWAQLAGNACDLLLDLFWCVKTIIPQIDGLHCSILSPCKHKCILSGMFGLIVILIDLFLDPVIRFKWLYQRVYLPLPCMSVLLCHKP